MSKEQEVKLVINIDHKSPIDLSCLSIGLNGLASVYSEFTKDDCNAKLLVKEVRKSSIEIDLVTLSFASAIPLINNTNNIIQFCSYIKLLIATCKSKTRKI